MEKEKLVALVRGAQNGEPEAMDGLFTAYYNDVYYFALKTVKDPDTACDITQETFLEIIRTIGNLKEPAAFVTWMKQITYHQCTRYFDKKKEVQVEEDEDGNSIFDTLADESEGALPSEVVEQEEFRQTILSMIDQLSEEQRAAVMLYYFDELSVPQIAQIQGVSEGTVKSRLNYARKAIKKSVESYEKKHNIKLHSIAFLPLFMLFFTKELMPEAKAAQVHGAVMAQVGAGTAAGAATAAAATAKTAAGFSLTGKLVAGGIAVTLAIGTGAALMLGGIGAAIVLPKLNDEVGPPHRQELPTESRFENDWLMLESASLEYQDVFAEYLSLFPKIIRTTDGRILKENDDGELEKIPLKNPSLAEKVFLLRDTLAYYDDGDVLHVLLEDAWIACPEVKGTAYDCQVRGSDGDMTGFTIYSYEESCLTYTATYDKTGYTGGSTRGFFRSIGWDTLSGKLDIPAQRYFLYSTSGQGYWYDSICIIDGTLYIPTGDSPHFDAETDIAYEPAEDTGIREADLIPCPVVGPRCVPAFRGEDPTILYLGFQLFAVDHHYRTQQLPEGKTVDQVTGVIGTMDRAVIVIFDDGTVYTNILGDWSFSEELTYHAGLTELNQAGRIRSYIISHDGMVFLILDDNLTYMLNYSLSEP